MQRRTLLKLGIAAGAVLAVAGGGLALVRPGWRDGRLTAEGRAVFTALARGMLGDPAPALLATHADRVEAVVGTFPPAMQAEVAELTTLLANAPTRLVLTGLATPWAEADAGALRAMFGRLQRSDLALRQQVYHAMRELTQAAHYTSPETWAALGYPGPLAV